MKYYGLALAWRIFVLLTVVTLLCSGFGWLLYAFNHPTFTGEATGAAIVFISLLGSFVYITTRLAFWVAEPYLKGKHETR